MLARLSLVGFIASAAFAQSIPPNYGYYKLNPEYTGEARLGWAEERVEEKLGRGMIALPTGQGSVYVGWRLLKGDPQNIAFNLYRSSSGGTAVRLNDEPIRATTDFVDTKAPLGAENAWWIRPLIDGVEGEPSGKAAIAQRLEDPGRRAQASVPFAL